MKLFMVGFALEIFFIIMLYLIRTGFSKIEPVTCKNLTFLPKNSAKREYAAPDMWRRTQFFFFRRIGSAPCLLHQCTVVFSLCACIGNAMCIIFIMWNSISGLEDWYHFRFNNSHGVAVMVRSHQEKFQVIFQGDGKEKKNLEGRVNFQGRLHF